jgi:hypothetical protein
MAWLVLAAYLTCWVDTILGRKARGFGPIKPPKWEALRPSDFGSTENTYLVVYIRFVVNRAAFYVPLLEEPQLFAQELRLSDREILAVALLDS